MNGCSGKLRMKIILVERSFILILLKYGIFKRNGE